MFQLKLVAIILCSALTAVAPNYSHAATQIFEGQNIRLLNKQSATLDMPFLRWLDALTPTAAPALYETPPFSPPVLLLPRMTLVIKKSRSGHYQMAVQLRTKETLHFNSINLNSHQELRELLADIVASRVLLEAPRLLSERFEGFFEVLEAYALEIPMLDRELKKEFKFIYRNWGVIGPAPELSINRRQEVSGPMISEVGPFIKTSRPMDYAFYRTQTPVSTDSNSLGIDIFCPRQYTFKQRLNHVKLWFSTLPDYFKNQDNFQSAYWPRKSWITATFLHLQFISRMIVRLPIPPNDQAQTELQRIQDQFRGHFPTIDVPVAELTDGATCMGELKDDER